eukprot:g8040.t1
MRASNIRRVHVLGAVLVSSTRPIVHRDLTKRTSQLRRRLPVHSTVRPEGELDDIIGGGDLEEQTTKFKQEPVSVEIVDENERIGVRDTGVFLLCLTNVSLFVLDHVCRIKSLTQLYLYHAAPRWWQFVTCAFCHASWAHLSSNLFLLYVFGKLIEEHEGALGLWTSYIICALGGSIVSWYLYPSSSVSLGASGAVFGLFTVSVLIRLSWSFKRLFEVCILGQFVIATVLQEVNLQLKGGAITASGSVGHLAHLGGALVGVIFILLLKQLPDPDAK